MTGLCTIPGCRIRNRHLPGCEDEKCAGCLPRVAEDGLVCEVDVLRTYERLDEIRGLVADALLVAYGLVRRETGGAGGKPGSRSPANDDAMDVLDDVNNRLTTMAREIADAQRLQEPSVGSGVGETITAAAKWLSGQMDWLRGAVDDQGGPYAAAVFAEIADCASDMRWLVNGPTGEQRFLGPCGAVREPRFNQTGIPCCIVTDCTPHDGPCCNHGDVVTCPDDPYEHPWPPEPCDGDVYVRGDARTGRCKTCGAEVDRGDREAWLDEQVSASDLAWTAKGIADAYSMNAKTIRSWATERRAENGVVLRRPKLATYWHNGTRLVPWVEPRPGEDVKARGDRLHYVADVVRLAKEAAAERERRMAARAAESETAA